MIIDKRTADPILKAVEVLRVVPAAGS